jgi:photosystem II stability/assembly factor-like uncharacterized protein
MKVRKKGICIILILFLNTFVCFAGKWKIYTPGVDNPENVFFSSSKDGCITGSALNGNLPTFPIHWTNDGGKKWHSAKIQNNIKNLQDYNLTGLWFSNKNIGWATGSGPKNKSILLKTTDGGKTWKQKILPKGITGVFRVWFDKKGEKGWLVSYSGPIWKTENAGKTWTIISNQINEVHPAFYAFSFSHLVLAGTNIYLTENAGKTWNIINLNLGPNGSISAISFAPDTKTTGWATGSEGNQIENGGWGQLKTQFVLKTTDGGKIWIMEKLPIKKLGFLTDVYAISSQEAWVSSFYGYAWPNPRIVPPRLFETTDGGKIWNDKTKYLISIRKIFFLNPKKGWAVGGQGGSPYEPPMAVLIYHK